MARDTDRISACLTDISTWMATHHLKLNLAKMELLSLPAKSSPRIDASITLDGTTVSRSVRNLGVSLDDQLSFLGQIPRLADPPSTTSGGSTPSSPKSCEKPKVPHNFLSTPWSSHTRTTATSYWLAFQPVSSSHFNSFRMRSHDWCSTFLHFHTSHHSSSQIIGAAMRGTAPSYLPFMITPYTSSRSLLWPTNCPIYLHT
ncbi:hypothetical protein AAFF_G00039430 [Aldrovandia affinis]|uniref:Reverse transcriptase domain-containing protein n=1 Tax=Aldrovandia affinis TaxID=143900 RepID=A0AAD7WFD6_9TELE|nr:hypothetical protein AAFF_G00039430 [Aldrovandia affinis]